MATRQALMRQLATAADWVAGTHLPFPGFGHVRPAGTTGYAWWPAPYLALPGA